MKIDVSERGSIYVYTGILSISHNETDLATLLSSALSSAVLLQDTEVKSTFALMKSHDFPLKTIIIVSVMTLLFKFFSFEADLFGLNLMYRVSKFYYNWCFLKNSRQMFIFESSPQNIVPFHTENTNC
jgi:hypothetical protein